MRLLLLLALLSLCGSCKEKDSPNPLSSQMDVNTNRFRESYRPQYHFTPPEKWMNDPNGLLFHKGIYHLFYQYYPDDIVWGPMHWGHATSKDLIKWTHKPVALYPDKLGYIFSGSAVMDTHNSSGLGTAQNPPMIAIFTYHDPKGEGEGRTDFQYQGIAYSLDEGDTWTKYEGNPVIGNDTIKDFRDPKVFWHDATQKWVMLLVAGDHLKIYNSTNLTEWTYLSDFGKNQGAHGGVWECPDLFELEIAGTQEKKWVLLISINPGAPNGGSGTQYFVGDFDGTRFTSSQKEHKWVDWGADNYAGVTYNGLPDSERTFMGWMSNWNYAQETPTEVWRSAMTLPRKLSLFKNNTGTYLKNYPLPAIDEYAYGATSHDSMKNNMTLSSANFNEMRLDFTIPGTLDDFQLNFINVKGNSLKIGFDKKENHFFIDRHKSGMTSFEPRFADAIHTAPAILENTKDVDFTLFMDTSSVELFVDKGSTVMTEQIFPDTLYTALTFKSKTKDIAPLTVSKIKRIWQE